MSIAKPLRMSQAPQVTFRTLNLAEAFREFGLDRDQIYAAAARGDVHPVERPPRDRRSVRGQNEYPEWELKKLANDLGVTPPPMEIVHIKSYGSYLLPIAA